MNILEFTCNCCGTSGTTDPYEDFCRRLDMLPDTLPPAFQKPIERIYLGFEFCENMFCMSRAGDQERKIQYASERGYRISFALPAMHESHVGKFMETIRSLESQDLLDEWIINDTGTLIMLREAMGVSRSVSLGRLFEKSIREARINAENDEFIRRNFEDLQPAGGESGEFVEFVQRYHITGMETDTFPDGVLDLTNAGLSYHVHYPDIYLSSAAYCELEGIGKEEPYLLYPACAMSCRSYGQRIRTARGTVLKKIENAMFTEQIRPIDECVHGGARLVYSCRL